MRGHQSHPIAVTTSLTLPQHHITLSHLTHTHTHFTMTRLVVNDSEGSHVAADQLIIL